SVPHTSCTCVGHPSDCWWTRGKSRSFDSLRSLRMTTIGVSVRSAGFALLFWGGWERSAVERVFGGGAACFCEMRPVGLHGLVFFQPVQRLPKYLGCSVVGRRDDAVMHPIPFAPG